MKHMRPIGSRLLAFGKYLLRDEEAAKDALQETYMKLWKERMKLAEVSNVTGLAIRVMRNTCIDKQRKLKPVSMNGHNHEEPVDSSSAKQLETQDLIEKIELLIGELPEQQKLVIQLRDVSGFSNAEVAEALKLDVGTVRVALSRARKKIREQMLKKYDYVYE